MVASLAMLGRTPTGPPSGSFEWDAHYGDGWDVNTAYGANPVMHQDPSGLFFSLGGLMSSQTARTGMKFVGIYDKLDPAFGFAKNIMSGISAQQAMLMLAADFVFGKASGKVFDKAVAGFNKAARISRSGHVGAGRPFSAADFGGVYASVPKYKIKAAPPRRGNAPIGDDGWPVELHHMDPGNRNSPLIEMTRTDHRLGANYKMNHPDDAASNIDRPEFLKYKREYWGRQCDSGRFWEIK